MADLTSQPYPVHNRDEHKVHSVIPALRREIAAYLLPPASEVAPRPVHELTEAVKRVSTLRQSASLDQLGAELPPLLAELRAAAHYYEGAERERVYGLLAEAYAAAGQVAYKLGYSGLSSLTTERVEWAARSGDQLAMAAADFYRAGELIATAEWRGALDYLDTARDAIADRLRTQDEAALAMHGVLHVKAGLAAARAGDADLSDAHLAEAQHAARHVTRGSDYYRLAFDTDLANIWAVGLAVERRDGTADDPRRDGGSSLIDEIVREGARRMLAEALQAEVDDYIARFAAERDENGHRLVVRNGSHRPSEVLTSAGAVEVVAPRVNDRRTDPQTGERARFSSAILPPGCRKTPKISEVLPLLYLHGLSSGDFVPALGQFLGSTAGLSGPVITKLTDT